MKNSASVVTSSVPGERKHYRRRLTDHFDENQESGNFNVEKSILLFVHFKKIKLSLVTHPSARGGKKSQKANDFISI